MWYLGRVVLPESSFITLLSANPKVPWLVIWIVFFANYSEFLAPSFILQRDKQTRATHKG